MSKVINTSGTNMPTSNTNINNNDSANCLDTDTPLLIKQRLYKNLATQLQKFKEQISITQQELLFLNQVANRDVIGRIGVLNGSLLMGANRYFEQELIHDAFNDDENNNDA
ncbi:Hsk3p SCDLUD_003985 [Saccharomycodes ludwigii]|uniref:Hsk3p n=1 Tax=Saccharomycodes ludwigii TaxID=36035 RepID=UPI001E8984B7|nr:hypothetical protein SCDLUD_003985 [Saccharomycodes ludwigii]KAH3899700.1 hypothetical protein SCDLUD_003985 [Saccharomycodes ludwigii]